MDSLFDKQISRLSECHFLVLYWAARAEGCEKRFNITNCFDDLKYEGITRTKQSAVATVESLRTLCFVELKEHGNRKNIYITKYGAKALESLILKQVYNPRPSKFLEEE